MAKDPKRNPHQPRPETSKGAGESGAHSNPARPAEKVHPSSDRAILPPPRDPNHPDPAPKGQPSSGAIPLGTAELEAARVSEEPSGGSGPPSPPELSGAKTVPAIPILSAQRLGGYPLLETLGSGGMATIYRSVQPTLKRPVALKVLKPAVAGEEMFAARFQLEARTLARLRHENIVQVYDHGVEAGLQFMVMELLEGIDLFALLEGHAPLPPELAAVVALHVARALEHIHYRGIVHRDIKPANIMVTYSGDAKLMDFGIARIEEEPEMTQHGMGLGTPSYMSPEQVMGDRLDGRTDIFSLGTVLFEMVTGRKPFVEDDQETVLEKIRNHRAPRARKVNPDVPRDLESIIARCHQPKRQDRYWPTRELVKALERFLASRGVESEQALVVSFLKDRGLIPEDLAEEQLTMARRSGYRPTKPVRKIPPVRRAPFLVAGAALLSAVSGLAGWLLAPRPREPAPIQPPAHVSRPPKSAGLRFVVEPWAHIHLDGRYLDTTPVAKVFQVPPGRHVVRFVNPYCTPLEEVLDVPPGRTLTIRRKLSCRARTHGGSRRNEPGKAPGGQQTPPRR